LKKEIFPYPYHLSNKRLIDTLAGHDNHQTHLQSYLLSLLRNLENIEQSPLYHPEGDALYHSIQVYQCAKIETKDPELIAAALLHDVGKAIDYLCHDFAGAEALAGLLSPKITWLIQHHLDLLRSPKKTRRHLAGSIALIELEQLRRWDLAGRNPAAFVESPQEAIEHIIQSYSIITNLAPISGYSI
jgi:exopolyphosphatase/pppGpp-phosphohydrolase